MNAAFLARPEGRFSAGGWRTVIANGDLPEQHADESERRIHPAAVEP